jgi:hypothetical protein
MLNGGHPPDSWDHLLAEAEKEMGRLKGITDALLE